DVSRKSPLSSRYRSNSTGSLVGMDAPVHGRTGGALPLPLLALPGDNGLARGLSALEEGDAAEKSICCVTVGAGAESRPGLRVVLRQPGPRAGPQVPRQGLACFRPKGGFTAPSGLTELHAVGQEMQDVGAFPRPCVLQEQGPCALEAIRGILLSAP